MTREGFAPPAPQWLPGYFTKYPAKQWRTSMYHVSYFKTVDSPKYICCMDHHALSFPERNESVMIVPGSVAQMQQDFRIQDEADLEYAARYDGYR